MNKDEWDRKEGIGKENCIVLTAVSQKAPLRVK